MKYILKILLNLCILISILSSCKTLPKEADFTPGKLYAVQPNDTLVKIAQKYKIDLQDLMETNGIENINDLKTNQLLFIPDNSQSLSIKQASAIRSTSKTNKSHKSAKSTQTLNKPKQIDTSTIALLWPLKKYKLIKHFSQDPKNPYEGLALESAKGSQVYAAADGEIIYVGNEGTSYGLVVIIKHKAPFVTVYAHLDKSIVKKGLNIKKGQAIGIVGTSGNAASNRIHFQLRKNRKPVNPEKYLS